MSDKFEMYRQLLSGGSTSDMSLFCNGCDDIIIIGGTRQQTFKLPFSSRIIDKIMVVYVQDGKIIIKKTNELNHNDFELSDFDDSLLYFTLREPDTIKFKEGPIDVQLKVSLKDGTFNQNPLNKDILVSKVLHAKGVMPIDSGFFIDGAAPIISLQANVNSRDISVNELFSIPAGTLNLFNIEFIFDSSWDIYNKKAVFKDEYNHYIELDIDENNLCNIPLDVITNPGNIYIGVIGEYNSIRKVSTWSNSIRIITSPLYNKNDDEDYDVDPASEDKAGILKLYNSAGYNTDGTVTQRLITEGFDSVDFVTSDSDDECLVLNVDFGGNNG